MALPVRAVTQPGCLTGQSNGRLTRSIMLQVNTPGVPVTLVRPAARAYAALQAAARADGIVFTVRTTGRSYRPYSEQEMIFRARYVPHVLWAPGRRKWAGRWWSKKAGAAAAAVPGTSNHGWGLAVDLSEQIDGQIVSLTGSTLVWLKIHAHRHGWSWELESEPWHLRYWAGDDIPTDVLRHETGALAVSEEDDMQPISIAYDETARKFRVFVVGEGSTLVDNPQHWVERIGAARDTGLPLSSPYLQDLLDKCRAERNQTKG